MPESTQSKSNMDRIEDVITKLSNKVEDFCQKVNHLETSSHSPTSSMANHHSAPPPLTSHCLKLEVLCFDGSDPFGWIFKITQFFEYHGTPETKRLTIASFYIEGPALACFQWMSRNS